MANITGKIRDVIINVKQHWNEAPDGRYIPFKEIVGYAGGGIGVKFLAVMAVNMILSSTNVLIGNTLGVQPIDMYILYVISVLVNIPLSGVRANIIDNTRSKEGKYRPYIVKMGIPSAVITILFVWFPYKQFGSLFGDGELFGRQRWYIVMCAVILILNFAQQFVYYFFSEAYDNLLHVLSPNTQERADVATIKGVVYSLAPSILNLIMPLFAQWFTNDNLYDIRLYRYIYPPISIVSVILCIVVYANTKEKIVQAKTHIIQIKFIDSLREVIRNKYFWVISMAAWLGFLESASTVILSWLYNYGGICKGGQYSLITLVCQNAGLVGMLLAPFFIRKFGKRAVLIITNIMNIVFIALMFPVVQMIDMTGEGEGFFKTWFPLILLVVCFWMNNLMNAFMQILTPTVNADIRDYQQYISGERIDGMFSTITAFGGIITVATSGVINFLYKQFGINEETANRVIADPDVLNRVMRNGSTVKDAIAKTIEESGNTTYFALYDNDILRKMLTVLIAASIIGAIINVIPYFFYDLTEIKQQGMVKVLKIRAFFEDFGNNTLSDSDLVEVVEMVDTAEKLINEKENTVSKSNIKTAKSADERKAAKKAYKEAVNRNTEIKLAPFVVNEMHRFEQKLGAMQLEDAKSIVSEGLNGLGNADLTLLKSDLKAAKRLPKSTDEEKEIRKYKINFCRTRITAKKYYNKYYSALNGIKIPDEPVLNELYNTEEQYDNLEDRLYKMLFDAKENGAKQEAKKIKAQIKELKNKYKELNKKINSEQDSRLSYTRSAKPLLDAQRIITQAENYTHFEEIKARYDEAKNSLASE